MIPKILLLSFLSLQGGFSNRKAQSSEGEEGLNTVGTTIELDVPEVSRPGSNYLSHFAEIGITGKNRLIY